MTANTQQLTVLVELPTSKTLVVLDPENPDVVFFAKRTAAGESIPIVPELFRGDLFVFAIAISDSSWLEKRRPDLALAMFDPRSSDLNPESRDRRLQRIDDLKRRFQWPTVPKDRRQLFNFAAPISRYGLILSRDSSAKIQIRYGDDLESKNPPRLDANVAGNLANLILRDEAFGDYLKEYALPYAPTDAPKLWIGGKLDPRYLKGGKRMYKQGTEREADQTPAPANPAPIVSKPEMLLAELMAVALRVTQLGADVQKDVSGEAGTRLRVLLSSAEAFRKSLAASHPDLPTADQVVESISVRLHTEAQSIRVELMRELASREAALAAGLAALAAAPSPPAAAAPMEAAPEEIPAPPESSAPQEAPVPVIDVDETLETMRAAFVRSAREQIQPAAAVP